MEWTTLLSNYISSIKPVEKNDVFLQKLITLIDATHLREHETESNIASYFEKIELLPRKPAAICVLPQFVKFAHAEFASTLFIDTVTNFPRGDELLEKVLIDINNAIADGANEIDLVYPKQLQPEKAHEFLMACKAACGDQVTLKVIVESGVLALNAIQERSEIALKAGANFIKTSTGREKIGATLEAAGVILLCIKKFCEKHHRTVGIKIAGGMRTIEDVSPYFSLTENIMGLDWIKPTHFRIGSSQLIETILKEL